MGIHNEDFTIIQSLETGLKTQLYLQARDDLRAAGWEGQSPPAASLKAWQTGLPKIGANYDKRKQLRADAAPHLLGKKAEEPKRVAKLSKKVPSVAEQVGRAVSHFGNYYDLTNKE